MNKGNVLVIGNSGVGKSTLINAVLGEERAKTGWGTEGTTKALEIYEGKSLPFRVLYYSQTVRRGRVFAPKVHQRAVRQA